MIYLYEDIDAVRKYYPKIDDSVFMTLIQLDPTYRDGSNSLGRYGKWILNLYNKGAISKDDFGKITPLLNQFTTYRNRIQNKDLNSYKTLDDLDAVVSDVVDNDSMLSDRQKLRFKKNLKAGRISVDAEDDYDIVLDTSEFTVYVPNTHEASMKLGKGTQWCTAHEDRGWYKKYTKNGGKLYIVKNKKTGERWQYSDKNGDFLDEHDEEFNILSLMLQDEKLSKFFEQFLGIDYYSFDGTWIYTGKPIPNDLLDSVKNIIIADGVTSIREDAFSGCSNLTSITISDGVTSIGDNAFNGCTGLTSITLPNSITEIGDHAFFHCSELTIIVIPDSVTSIGSSAFAWCFRLKSITIPDSVTHIGIHAFELCSKIITIYTDNDYVIRYCKKNYIKTKPKKKFKNESIRMGFKLKISETEKQQYRKRLSSQKIFNNGRD